MAVTGFSWKYILLNLLISLCCSILFSAILGITPGWLGFIFVSLIVTGIQIELGRRNFLKNTNKKMLNSLGKIAREHQEIVYQSVQNIFDRYETEIRLKIANTH